MWECTDTDYLVIGSGVAGLTFSLLASEFGNVTLVTKSSLAAGNSRLAQGGIAAAISPDDTSALHTQDTLRTGQGLCEPDAVKAMIEDAPDAIQFLQELGAELDKDVSGNLLLGKEGAHSRHRIVHAGGDATGRVVVDTLLAQLHERERISVCEDTYIADLLMEDGECRGAIGKNGSGKPICIRARAVILATGGLGQLYKFTTNSLEITGDGFALAYRAGAKLRDMEFIQFHPTALQTDAHPLPLISEAVRGEGAILVNSDGERFMKRYHAWMELASRDVVSRAIYTEMQSGRDVFLDATSIPDFATRFPTIHAFCQKIGLDPVRDLLPVVPAAHYTMGGIETDDQGVTSVPRLFAIGEAASSGLHGANRLASNSLLEGLVMARRLAQIVSLQAPLPESNNEIRHDYAAFVKMGTNPNPKLLAYIQNLMWQHVGIVRDQSLLAEAYEQIQRWLDEQPPLPTPDRNLITTARLVIQAALWRNESRGAHYRLDFPDPIPAYQTHSIQGGTHESVTRTPISTASSY